MICHVKRMECCIFNLHAPPYNSLIDKAIEVTFHEREMVQTMSGTEPKWISVGSKSVRHIIEKYQPLLGLHGHIHESRGIFKIGRTICINPGSKYSDGVLRGVIVMLEKRSATTFFTSG